MFSWQFMLQSLIVIAAVCAALYIYNSPAKSIANSDPQSLDMLAFLDDKISCQEDEKDVRCWSSVNKIQMFLAGSEISHEAVSARIENYMQMIDSIWQDAKTVGAENGVIPKASLSTVLTQRFPHEIDSDTNEAKFQFADQSEPVLVLADALQDYGDTIEPWRLLQTWASRKTDRQGKLTITPVFSHEALQEFYGFLKVYDIALLKHASQIANRRKLAEVDAESMNLAFSRKRQSNVPKPALHFH